MIRAALLCLLLTSCRHAPEPPPEPEALRQLEDFAFAMRSGFRF